MSKQKKSLGPVTQTGRGFEVIEFRDRYDQECTLQQSSLADYTKPGSSAVWLGTGEDRMHIDYDQAKLLVSALKRWIKTGSFSKKKS
jgi:hypothetical protein